MKSWKFSKSLSSVMFFRKGSNVLIPRFDSSLSRDVNSTVSRLKWGTATILPMNLCRSWCTPSASSSSSSIVITDSKYQYMGSAHLEALHPWVSGRALFEMVTMFLLTCCSLGMIQPWELRAFNTESGQMTSSPSIQPLFKAGTWKRKLKQFR